MNVKRATGIAILLYIATFAIGLIVGITLGTDFSGETQISGVHWMISIILSIILAALFSWWYFAKKDIQASAKEGLLLGLMFLVVGAIGDLLIVLPYMISGLGNIDALLSYYKDIWFYISVLLIVLTPIGMGLVLEKKGKRKKAHPPKKKAVRTVRKKAAKKSSRKVARNARKR